MSDDRPNGPPNAAAPAAGAAATAPVQVHVDVSPPGAAAQDGTARVQPGPPGAGAHVIVDVQIPTATLAPVAPPVAPPAAPRPRPDAPPPPVAPPGGPQLDGPKPDARTKDQNGKKDQDAEKDRGGKGDHPTPVRRRSLIIGALVILALLAGFLLIGILPRRARDKRLQQQSEQGVRNDSIPAVNVIKVASGDSVAEFSLPGNVQAQREAAVYARATGYVRRYLVDIGQRVRAGQVLAELEVPDVQEQLREARANANQSGAALRLARVELGRFRILYRDSVITREELDQRQANYDASVASVAAAEANVRRTAELVGFASVTAPFAGVVTARNVDQGVLVGTGGASTTTSAAGLGGNTVLASNAGQATPAGGGSALSGAGSGALGASGGAGGAGSAGGVGGSSGSLFRIAQADTVRLYVGVPQSYSGDVRTGLRASVRVAEMPQHMFLGRVVRTAGALDAATRTLLTEVDLPNLDRRLLPGMYATVNFRLTRATPPVTIPAGALLVRQNGPQAAVVGPDSVLQIRTLTVGRDFGSALEVLTGLKPGELVVVNPTDDLRNGQHVRPRPQAEGGAPGGNSPGGRPANPPPPKPTGDDKETGGQKPQQGGPGGSGGSAQGAGGGNGAGGGTGGGGAQSGGSQSGGGQSSGGGQGGGGGGSSQASSQQPPVVRIGPPGRPSGIESAPRSTGRP